MLSADLYLLLLPSFRLADFFHSVFELCDLWADGTNFHDYQHLLRVFEAKHKEGVEQDQLQCLRKEELAAEAQNKAAFDAVQKAVQSATHHSH